MNYYLDAMRRYFDFGGRSSRPQFWFFVLFVVILSVVAAIVDAVFFRADSGDGTPVLSGIVSLVHMIPGIAISVRRLHDIDRTGWWILLGFAPSVAMVALIFGSFVFLAGGGDTGAGLAAMGISLIIAGVIALLVLIVLIVFYCTPGTPDENRFGPRPQSA